VEAMVGRMVHTLMFTPVKDDALSVEDNMILHDALSKGMNRYSSAGMTCLVYPKALAQEYVTLCSVRKLIRSEWMLIDDKFRAEVAQARSLQRTDGKTEMPQMKTSYPELFREQVDGEGCLGKLFNEAFATTPERQVSTRSGDFLMKIDELVEKVMQSDEVVALASQCQLIADKMNTFNAANQEIIRLFSAMADYLNAAKRLVSDKPINMANTLFPPTVQSMALSRNNSNNIYGLFHNVHPLTARFFCYDMIGILETRIQDLDVSVRGIDFKSNLEEDFDIKT
jgi:hypothetical protein